MYLKSLTLRGFKSFASATTIDLEPGITCVVGPNGSGKSNVVDAIAWVMGEQGAKSLRGGKMEDVIFAGTTGKAPLGRAEVELTIDNTDGALPIDYTEVSIRRTLFRSGGSDYAINGQTCRLLDVQELLADSGIGREMHVIVGQGRLDAILHASPEDRRGFIEEAAGVLKHRRRKEKALRKLEQIQQNLQRLTDLAAELRRQLKPLGRQAEVARRAVTIQADARDARLRLLADDIATVQHDLAEEQADESAAKSERERVEASYEQARAAEVELEQRLQELAPALQAVRIRAVDLTRLRERTHGLVAVIRERRRSLEREQLEFSFGVDPEDLQRQSEAVAVAVAEQDEVAAAAQALFEQARAAAESVARTVREEQESVMAAERALTEYRQRLAAAEQAVSGGQRLVATTQTRADKLADQVDIGRREAHDAAVALAELPPFEAADESIDTSAADDALRAAEKDAQLARAELSTQEQRRASLTARCEALRSALSTSGDETLPDDLQAGSLDSVIRVRPGFEKAIAALLGADARARVLRDGVRAADVLSMVGEDHSVRLVVPAPATTDLPVADEATALTFVDAPEHLHGSLAGMLRDCFIVDDFGQAESMVAQRPMALVSTLAGQVLGRGIAGQGAEGANVIAVRNALEQATGELVSAEGCWQRAVDHVSRVEARLTQARTHRDEVRNAAAAQQARAAAAAERDIHIRQRAATAAGRLEQLRTEHEEVLAALGEHIADLQAARDQVQELQQAGVPLVDRSRLTSVSAEQERARHAHHEASLNARSTRERHASLLARHHELMQQVDQARAALLAAARRREQREEALVVLGHLETLASRVAGLVDEDAVAVDADLAAMEGEQARVQSEHSQARGAAVERAAEVDRLTQDVHRDEVLRAGKHATLEQLAEKALEDFGLPVADLVSEYGPDQMIPGSEDEEDLRFDRVQQQRRLKEAERGLALLGRVNPLALEEFAAMEERHTHLVNQIEDIKKSREDLLDIVAGVDARVQEVFSQAYADVAREFEYAFSRLFPGGQGRLVLTDPDDLLITGVEVEARPPGKKIKRLSLLSGGERSLTAVAFLVALFKARPSPFYLLDEVEAALDDVNLGRLIGLLEELRQTSQLLVVTHQKRTMEMADALYGVTMRAGVTEVISQRMRQLQPV
ncbi:MAG TPA: chromosome segregation protein SMC [Dermatophilaceae bacterium]|nr:chromosome segregation protein SMC [Dermatophilaceae bacterium]